MIMHSEAKPANVGEAGVTGAKADRSGLTGADRLFERRSQRWMLRGLLFALAVTVAMLLRASAVAHWDGWDYTAQIIRGHSSGLALGRWWYIATMRVVWLASHAVLGLERLQAHVPVQVAGALMFGAAVATMMVFVGRVTRSIAAEVLTGILLILAPLMVGMGAVVMTEPMALLTLAVVLLTWESAVCCAKDNLRRGRVLALVAGAVFGVMVDVREPLVLMGVWVVARWAWQRPRSWSVLGLGVLAASITLGIGLLGAVMWYPWKGTFWDGFARWSEYMATERQLHPLDLYANVRWMSLYMLAASPLITLMLGLSVLWAFLRRRKLLWLLVAMGPYTLAMLANHDLSVNPRYSLPIALLAAPLVGTALSDLLVARPVSRRWAVPLALFSAAAAVGYWLNVLPGVDAFWTGVALAAACAVAICMLDSKSVRLAAASLFVAGWGTAVLLGPGSLAWKTTIHRAERRHAAMLAMLEMEPGAVVIPGPATPVAHCLNHIGKTRLIVLSSGGAWDGDGLSQIIATRRAQGRPVYVNINKLDWRAITRENPEWSQLTSAMSDYELRPARWPMVRLVAKPPASPSTQAATAHPAEEGGQ